jgi:ABC-type Fe3+ transport system permease subunit
VAGCAFTRKDAEVKMQAYLYLSPLILVLGLMIIYPLIQIAHTTFTEFDLLELLEIFNPSLYSFRSLIFTLWVATATTLLSTIIGYSVALVLRTRRAYVGSITQLLRLPLFVPYIVIGFIGRALLGPRGHVTMIINGILTPLGFEPVVFLGREIGIILAHMWICIPIIFIMMYAVLLEIDEEIIEAAKSLGAKGWTLIHKIYLPLSWHGLSTASSIVFLASLVGISIPLIMGSSPTYFPVHIFFVLVERFDRLLANAISLLFALIAITVAFVYFKLAMKGVRGNA